MGPDLQFLGDSKLLGEGSQQAACELASREAGEMTEICLNYMPSSVGRSLVQQQELLLCPPTIPTSAPPALTLQLRQGCSADPAALNPSAILRLHRKACPWPTGVPHGPESSGAVTACSLADDSPVVGGGTKQITGTSGREREVGSSSPVAPL